MGVLELVSELCSLPCSHGKLKKKKPLQTVELKVRMDCEGCERRIRHALEGMKGVRSVEVDPKQKKVTVEGYVEVKKVMRRIERKTGKKAEPWPYVPYEVVEHPYAPGAYDKKAPPGYVRNVLSDPEAATLARASSTEVKYTTAFSDDNPNSCAVM
ncbi:heavy metal-associated isoprenylated plant protein 27-like [Zingiber officinale]|uniref:heavy metal-associated isoprenylated plant protein 27-like n=1 Tax=Zingiber officinale TaxID=94328 RepID=UPI001C4A7B0F|nr:heavy metal-associated isoprenylated plant protein 27-like [Zingiber officinale]